MFRFRNQNQFLETDCVKNKSKWDGKAKYEEEYFRHYYEIYIDFQKKTRIIKTSFKFNLTKINFQTWAKLPLSGRGRPPPLEDQNINFTPILEK